jgi:hypothetical protein
MSAKIRGAEVTVRLAVEGRPLEGSFFKATSFTVRPRQDIVEDDYLGEDETDLDFQHHGYDFSMTCHNIDDATETLLQEVVDNELAHKPPLRLKVTVLYKYRERGVDGRAAIYHQAIIKVGEQGFKGRKERVTTEIEGKARKRSLIAA